MISVAGLDDLLGIEAGGGLVEDQHVGIVDDGLREADALPVAFRKLADQLVADIADGAALHDFVDAARRDRSADALELADEVEVLADLHFRVERRRFGQVADALLHLHRLLHDVEAGDIAVPAVGRQEAGENAHGGGFPGAVRAEEADDLPLFHFKGDIVDSDVACVSLRRPSTLIILRLF